MKVISFVNQKGGVAKTTSCLNIGAALAQAGKKVLLVDMDPQGSLTMCAGITGLNGHPTLYEVLKGEAEIKDILRTKQSGSVSYDILPSDFRMSVAESQLFSRPDRNLLLKNVLAGVSRKYDFVLIDCGPSLSLLPIMALTASDRYIIPVTSEYMPLQGVSQLEIMASIAKRSNKKLKLLGIIITKHDSRRTIAKEAAEVIQEHFPGKVFEPYIRNNSKLAEAPAFKKDIFDYAPKSPGAEAYAAIAEEILRREGKQ